MKPETYEKYRILIIDDDRDLLDIMAGILEEDLSFEVKIQSDSFQAGLYIGSWRPDLIILDMRMPGMNGFEICRKIRDNPRTRHIPVLAVTGLTTPESQEAVRACGVSDYLGKPFRGEDLFKKVRGLLALAYEDRQDQKLTA